MTTTRDVDERGNCSRCGGVHYGSGPRCVYEIPQPSAGPDAVAAAAPRREVLGAAEAAVPADTTHFCVDCTQPIIGAMYGAGDGSGQRFRHPECHWRDAAHTYEMDMLDAREAGRRLLDTVASIRSKTLLWRRDDASKLLREIHAIAGDALLDNLETPAGTEPQARPTNETPVGVADPEALRGALRDLYEPAKIAVNQIICMGGADTCQPCENRERLAIALEAARAALSGDLGGTRTPDENDSGGARRTGGLAPDATTEA